MLSLSDLKTLLHKKGLSQTNALLLMIAADGDAPKSPGEIVQLGLSAGVRGIRKWNVSARLAASNGKAINTPNGWELTDAGRKHIANELGVEINPSPMSKAASGLAKHLSKIKNSQIREFVEEAIECLDHGHRRAAVVLSWVGAVAILQEYIVSNRLADFNAEAVRRNNKWKTATNAEDISSRMEEFEFLQTCAGISLFGKSVKNRLEQALKLRNGAGHPNQLAVGELEDAAHVESLVKNVFEKFAI